MGEKKKKDEGKEKKHDNDKTLDFRLQEGTALHFKDEKKDDDHQAVWVTKAALAYEMESCTTGRAGGLNCEPLKAVENLEPPKGGGLFK